MLEKDQPWTPLVHKTTKHKTERTDRHLNTCPGGCLGFLGCLRSMTLSAVFNTPQQQPTIMLQLLMSSLVYLQRWSLSGGPSQRQSLSLQELHIPPVHPTLQHFNLHPKLLSVQSWQPSN